MRLTVVTGIILALLLSTIFFAFAIPQHSHTGPPSYPETVTWEYESETHPNPPWGDSPHQHHCRNDFYELSGNYNQPYGIKNWVWDNENLLLNLNPADWGNHPYPHGFIDERQGSAAIPDYFFKGDWSSSDAQMAQFFIMIAFAMWSNIEGGKSPVSHRNLETGIAFQRTNVESDAEIVIFWGGTTELGRTIVSHTDNTWNKPVKVYFNTHPIKNETHQGWFFGPTKDTPATQYHFFSTALHEVGHVLGLAEQLDYDDVMIEDREPGNSTSPDQGPAFDSIDQDSREGAVDLYSIQVYAEIEELSWTTKSTSEGSQLAALLTHEADVGGVPRPTDIQRLLDAGYTILNETQIGYSPLFLNNRLYPFDDIAVRKAVNRLIDKEKIVEELFTAYVDGIPTKTLDVCDYWLPPGQQAWINYDCLAPSYAPEEADAILDGAGYVMNPQTHIRIDPETGMDMEPLGYVTISPEESSLGFWMAYEIYKELNAHGLPVMLAPKSFNEIVAKLAYPPLDDWQMMTGVTIAWKLHETVMYDFFESTQEPLWNVWGVRDPVLAMEDLEIFEWVDMLGKHIPAADESRLDWWCHEMKLTLDFLWETYCTKKVQEIASELEPYSPLLLSNGYTAYTGPYDDEPGYTRIVNAAGDLALGVKLVFEKMGGTPPRNRWTKMFSGREGLRLPSWRWILPEQIHTLNPTIADSAYEWEVLDLVCGSDMDQTPYYLDYVWWLTDGFPQSVAEDYQVGMQKQHSSSSYEASSGWVNPENAYTSDNVYTFAQADDSSVAYAGFNFPSMNFPNWDVTNVEVGVEAYAGLPGDDYITLEAYNGTYWTDPVSYTPPTSDPNMPTYVDVTGAAIWNDLSQLKVKVTKKGTGPGRERIYVDWLKVRVKIAPEGCHFGETVTGMYVEYKLRPNMNWTDGHNGNPPITAADVAFGLNLLRFQNNMRYRSVWDKIYKIEVIDELTVRIWYVDQFVYHFEEIGVFLYTPKHIWEDFIVPETEPLYDPFQDDYYDFWIDWDRHHSEWRGWENQRSEMDDYPDEYWTDLIGVGPFVYPHGGWEPGVGVNLYRNHEFIGGRICRADVDINGICDMRDVFQVLYRQGATPGSARWEEEMYNMQGPAADVAPPAQWIGGEEIYLLKTHFGHKWLTYLGVPVLPPPCY